MVAVTFATGLLLYGFTCAPGVVWQDSAMFQFRLWHGDLQGDLGLPLAHPLYILLAKPLTLLPLGSFAFRVNLFSAVCGAAALALAMDLLWVLTRSRLAAVCGTVLLGVSHTFWTHAVIAEVYDLYAVGLLAELCLLERFFRRGQLRWLVLACLANGLNLSNHHLALLHWPAYLGVVIWAIRARRLHIRHVGLLAAAFVAGATPYWVLIVRQIVDGQPLGQTLVEALVGPADRSRFVVASSFPVLKQFAKAAVYFAMNFPTPLALLAPIGAWRGWRRPETRWFVAVGLGVFAVDFVFAFRYLVPDQYVFFMPCYVLFALLAGLAVPNSPWQKGTSTSRDAVFDRVSRVRLGASPLLPRAAEVAAGPWWRQAACLAFAVLPALVYEAAPPIVRRAGVSLGFGRDIPYRDNYDYFLRPRKNGDDSAERFARQALSTAAPDGLLYADTTIKNVLVYARDVEGVERDVTLTYGHDTTPAPPVVQPTPESFRPFVERGVAFICSDAPNYLPPWISAEYTLEPAYPVFRLRPKPPASAKSGVTEH